MAAIRCEKRCVPCDTGYAMNANGCLEKHSYAVIKVAALFLFLAGWLILR
jgi:hypothetical protein